MIYESILTTLSPEGVPHIAPFGVRERNGLILIAPFRPSVTLDNLLSTRHAVLNFTDDVRVFAGSLSGHRDWPLTKASKIDGVVLSSALTHRELALVEVKEDQVRPELYFRVVHEETHAPFRGFNRAQAAVIELAVLVSRLHMLPLDKIETELNYLKIAIEKTAGERELEAWQWLVDKVENHKAMITGENQA
ncbi:DUF447 family protein [Methylobacillus methanolivorans]